MNTVHEEQSSSALLSGSYLLKIAHSARFYSDPEGDGDVRTAEVSGKMRLYLDTETNRNPSIGFGASGFGVETMDGRYTGVLSLRGLGGEGVLVQKEGRDYLESNLRMEYLDELIIRNHDLIRSDEDTYVSPTDIFEGSLVGTLQPADESLDRLWLDGNLSLYWIPSAHEIPFGGFRRIEITFTETMLYRTGRAHIESPQGSGSYLSRSLDCVEDHTVNPKLMHLQMVKFMAHEGDIPTGGKADQMLEKANALWNPGHIFFEDLHTPQPIISASLKTQPHYEKLYDIRPNKNVDKLISVFFVAYDLDCSGGGYTPEGFTVNALHAQAAIVISESAKSEFVLAHELGHVLGGLHPPLGAPSSGQWYGDNDTILAEFPFPKRNSRRNCLLAASPALEKTNTSVALCIESVAWSVDE